MCAEQSQGEPSTQTPVEVSPPYRPKSVVIPVRPDGVPLGVCKLSFPEDCSRLHVRVAAQILTPPAIAAAATVLQRAFDLFHQRARVDPGNRAFNLFLQLSFRHLGIGASEAAERLLPLSASYIHDFTGSVPLPSRGADQSLTELTSLADQGLVVAAKIGVARGVPLTRDFLHAVCLANRGSGIVLAPAPEGGADGETFGEVLSAAYVSDATPTWRIWPVANLLAPLGGATPQITWTEEYDRPRHPIARCRPHPLLRVAVVLGSDTRAWPSERLRVWNRACDVFLSKVLPDMACVIEQSSTERASLDSAGPTRARLRGGQLQLVPEVAHA